MQSLAARRHAAQPGVWRAGEALRCAPVMRRASPRRAGAPSAAQAATAVQQLSGTVSVDNSCDPHHTVLRGAREAEQLAAGGDFAGAAASGSARAPATPPLQTLRQWASLPHNPSTRASLPHNTSTRAFLPHDTSTRAFLPHNTSTPASQYSKSVEADDFSGLIRALAWTLTGLGLSVANALIETHCGRAHDVFYVTGARRQFFQTLATALLQQRRQQVKPWTAH